MAITFHQLRDLMTNLLDTASSEPDPVKRLMNLRSLDLDWHERVVSERDAACYTARSMFAMADLMELTGLSRQVLNRYVTQHVARTGAAPVKRRARVDLSKAHVLTDPTLR